MKQKIKILIIVSLFGLLLSSLTSCSTSTLTEKEARELPVSRITASFMFDTTNPRESVGMCDYVFVGRVISYDGVQYKHEIQRGTKTVGSPHTEYTIQVLDNIKGKLITKEPIHILKEGGVAQDGNSVYLHERDLLPESGKKYVFLGYAQPDGSIIVSGPESNIPVSENNSTIDKYYDAYKNEILPALSENTKYHSVYEE